MGKVAKAVKKIVSVPFDAVGSLFSPDIPGLPEPPPPPPDPTEMPDPGDEVMRKRRAQAAVRRRASGRQGTILSDATETLG